MKFVCVRLWVLFALMAAFAVAASERCAADGARRVALVVGVARYQHAAALANPANDAKAMEALLQRLGFDVDTVIDPTRVELEEAIRRFGRRSVGADVSLFHYSGHALEADGRNWLLPATFDAAAERDMPFEAVDLATALDQAASSARVTLVFLDACRNNPFTPRLVTANRGVAAHGLAEVATPAAGALIAFATAPGEIAADGAGANSPFTAALLRELDARGVEIKTVMGRVIGDVVKATDDQQRPWMTFTLRGDFYLNPAPPATPAAAEPATTGAEALFWQTIMASRNPADYVAYLDQFPKGVFAALAARRINDLAGPAGVAPQGAVDREGLIAQFLARRIAWPYAVRNAEFYLSRPDHRALVASDDTVILRTSRPSLDNAEELALEGCEIWGKKPCALLAAEGSWAAKSEQTTPRRMARAAYDGLFDPAMIPLVDDAVRHRADVQGYRAAAGPKAAALLVVGVFAVAHAASQRQAEEAALAQCNQDPARTDMTGSCFLYAVGDRVVLRQALRQPMTMGWVH